MVQPEVEMTARNAFLPLDLLIEALLETPVEIYQNTLTDLQGWMDQGDVEALLADFLQRLQGLGGLTEDQKGRISYVLARVFLYKNETSESTAHALSKGLVGLFDLPGTLLQIAINDQQAEIRAKAIQYLGQYHHWLIRGPEFLRRLEQLNTRGSTVEQMAAAFALKKLREFYKDDRDIKEIFDRTLQNSGSWRVKDLLNEKTSEKEKS